MKYRVQTLSCFIGDFGDKVAKEFLNGDPCAKADFKKLALLVMYLEAIKCQLALSSVFILENGSNDDNILLESGDCLLMEQQ